MNNILKLHRKFKIINKLYPSPYAYMLNNVHVDVELPRSKIYFNAQLNANHLLICAFRKRFFC